jgi:hypothetical protein
VEEPVAEAEILVSATVEELAVEALGAGSEPQSSDVVEELVAEAEAQASATVEEPVAEAEILVSGTVEELAVEAEARNGETVEALVVGSEIQSGETEDDWPTEPALAGKATPGDESPIVPVDLASALLPGEPLSTGIESMPTVPLEDLTTAAGENVLVPAPGEFAPIQEDVTPVAAPVEPLLTSAEETLASPQAASFLIKTAQETELAQEAEGVSDELEQAANDEQAELTEKENETLENMPTVPLQELVSASEEGKPLTAEAEMVAGEEPLAVEAEVVAVGEEREALAVEAEVVAVGEEREPPAVEDEVVAGKEREALAFEDEVAAASEENALQDSPVEPVLADAERMPAPVQVEAFLGHEPLIAPRLIISSPYTHSSFEFLLLDEEIHIGRAGASDLYLEQDNLTSRHHALLKRVGERVLIFDKRSYNGVFLNGQKIEVARGYELADGDHIGIGNYELIFRVASASHISQLI